MLFPYARGVKARPRHFLVEIAPGVGDADGGMGLVAFPALVFFFSGRLSVASVHLNAHAFHVSGYCDHEGRRVGVGVLFRYVAVPGV